MLPDIMSWPRGSNMSPVRIQSYSLRKCWRRSLMEAPCSCGPPPATTRTGLPQVCASTQKKVWTAMPVFYASRPDRATASARLEHFPVALHPPLGYSSRHEQGSFADRGPARRGDRRRHRRHVHGARAATRRRGRHGDRSAAARPRHLLRQCRWDGGDRGGPARAARNHPARSCLAHGPARAAHRPLVLSAAPRTLALALLAREHPRARGSGGQGSRQSPRRRL